MSIAGLVLDDKRILEAHNKAVNATLDYIEKNYTKVRIHEGEQLRSEFTDNLLAAKFQHISSCELDPQLHTHCLVMNLTANIRFMLIRAIVNQVSSQKHIIYKI